MSGAIATLMHVRDIFQRNTSY